MQYNSEIEVGKKYKDIHTGIEGRAAAISFYEYACERVSLETLIKGKIEEYTFDAERLVSVETKEKVKVKLTGGDRPGMPRTGLK